MHRYMPQATYPRTIRAVSVCMQTALLFGLAPGGVYPATTVTSRAVRSYRTISPLPSELGGIFSVALAISSRFPDVIWHPAHWSPDFPHH